MTDSVDALRAIALFASPANERHLLSAAKEIEFLRHSLGQISRYAQKFLPGGEAMEEVNRRVDRETSPKSSDDDSWEKAAKSNTKINHPMKFAMQCLHAMTKEQRDLFGDHMMTRRAWRAVQMAGLIDFESFWSASLSDLRRMNNAGNKTVSEIARLRERIISQSQGDPQ